MNNCIILRALNQKKRRDAGVPVETLDWCMLDQDCPRCKPRQVPQPDASWH